MKHKKNVYLFVTNDFLTGLGNSIFTILIMWYVYEVTQTALATAVIGSLTHVSNFFAGPIAGVYADRSKRPLALLKRALRINGVLVIGMMAGIYALSGDVEIWAIFILVALREVTFALQLPAQTRIMPMLVPIESLSKLVGYRSVSSNIADLLGNSISGFLLASIGIIGGLAFNSVTFFVGAILIGFVNLLTLQERKGETEASDESDNDVQGENDVGVDNTPDLSPEQANSFKQDMIEGFKYIWAHEYIRKVTIIATLVNITSMVLPMFVVYFNDFLDASAKSYGIFNALLTVGSILSGLIIGRISRTFKNGTIIIAGWLFLSVILIAMFLNVPVWITYGFGFLLGIGLTLPSITLETVQVLVVPDQYRGRVQTIMQAVGVVLIPFANFLGGFIADSLGANYVYLFAGIWQIFAVVIVAFNRHIFQVEEQA